MKDKKGGDKVISVYWFVILIIIAGGIFAMVSSFYNHPYDVREVEAGIMINKISDCLSTAGELNFELNQQLKDNFLDNCNLNLNVEDKWEKPQYYFEINFYKEDDLTNSNFTITLGDKALTASCNIQEEKEYKREVKCVEDDFFSLSETGELYLIKILSIVKKTEKNVK